MAKIVNEVKEETESNLKNGGKSATSENLIKKYTKEADLKHGIKDEPEIVDIKPPYQEEESKEDRDKRMHIHIPDKPFEI